MKKLNVTKEAFEKSKYFTEKYGKLEYVSESGKLFKTEKGQILKFKESAKAKSTKPVKESAQFLDGYKEGGALAKVDDIVDATYGRLCDELEKAGIDYDAIGSDDGIFFNDPEAKKTYFINLYINECEEYEGESTEKVNEAIPKTLKDIPKEQAEKLIQKHLRAGTGEWESSPGYSDFIYEIGGGRYKLIRPGFGGRYETGIVSM